jgi:RNA polymerase sigma factor (sigma-70 family)
MTDDIELLRRYLDEHSQEAFTELVQRHLDLVYGAAFRRTDGDASLAEDIAQQVFTLLAREAPRLRRHPQLAGWLYVATRHAAASTRRAERRRKLREEQAMNDLTFLSDPDWRQLRPELDAVIDKLAERDRDAVLLRFFEAKAFADIGAALGISEDAARMRVERALEKLRLLLAHRGIASTATALALVLANQAAVAAPSGLAASVAGTALAGAAAGTAPTFLTLMSITKTQLSLVGVLIFSGSVGSVWQQQTRAEVRDALTQVQRQRDEIARLGAANSSPSATLATLPADDGQAAAELARLQTEAAALRTQIDSEREMQPAPVVAGLMPASTWRKAGFGTPAEAVETLYWAKDHVDLETLGNALILDQKGRAKAEALLARLPDWLRKQYPELSTPEQMVGLLWALGPTVEAIGIGRATTRGPDNVTLSIKQEWENGDVRGPPLTFQRTSNGWKWAMPAVGVDMAARALDTILPPPPAPKP